MWQREEEFKDLLKKAVTKASRSSIEELTDLAVADQTWCYKHVCALVEKQMAKAAPKHRKNIVYVMSSICRQSKARLGSKDRYGPRFELMLQRCARLLGDASRDDLAQVAKVVRSWGKEGIFSTNALSEFEGALEQAAATAIAERPAASPEAPAADMDFDPGHTFEEDGAVTQAPPPPASSRRGWGTSHAAAEQLAHDPLAAGGLSNGQLPPPPPMEAPWDHLAKKARGSRWGVPMPGGGASLASQPTSEPRLPPPPAPAQPAAGAAHLPAPPAMRARSTPLSAPSLPPAPMPPQPQPPSAQQPLPMPPAPPALPPTHQSEASEGLKRALAIAARLTRSETGQALAPQAGSAGLPGPPAPPSSGSHAPAMSVGPPPWVIAPPHPPGMPLLGRSSTSGAASFSLGQLPPGLSAPGEGPAPPGPGDAGSLLLSMLGPPVPRKPSGPQQPPPPLTAGMGAGQGVSSADKRAMPTPPKLSALFAPSRPPPPSQLPPPSHQAWQGHQPRPPPATGPPPPAMNPLPPAPAGHAQYGAPPGAWAGHPQHQAGAPLHWNGLHPGQQPPGAGQPSPWFGQPRPPPSIPLPAPPPGNPGTLAGPRAPPPLSAAAPPAPPAAPYPAPGTASIPKEHHATEASTVPPPPPDEPSTARARDGGAAGTAQPDEAPGEAGAAAPVPMVASMASLPPPPPPALPARATKEKPCLPVQLGPLVATQLQQAPISALAELAPDGKVLHIAKQHTTLPGGPAQNGHTIGDGDVASVQVSSASNSSALDEVWSAAAAVLPDIAALQSPKPVWR